MTTFLPAEVAQTLLKLTAGPDSVVVGRQAVSLWAAVTDRRIGATA
jgi:hypothetical protein